ncbi:unnamed protein product [Diabrotica balteata]|uniref:Uncharacterized protein n=1 Tax=Diabrotica balteata TaxID=107213 RepID=A0A9N9X4Q1_DIABA|nr:unnamed protein product [Diabrotica balteata]
MRPMMITVLQGGSARRRRKHLTSTHQIIDLADAVLLQSLPPLAAAAELESAMGHKTIQSNLPKMPEFALSKASSNSDSLQEEVCAKETMVDVESVDSSGKNGAACKCEKQQQKNEGMKNF